MRYYTTESISIAIQHIKLKGSSRLCGYCRIIIMFVMSSAGTSFCMIFACTVSPHPCFTSITPTSPSRRPKGRAHFWSCTFLEHPLLPFWQKISYWVFPSRSILQWKHVTSLHVLSHQEEWSLVLQMPPSVKNAMSYASWESSRAVSSSALSCKRPVTVM